MTTRIEVLKTAPNGSQLIKLELLSASRSGAVPDVAYEVKRPDTPEVGKFALLHAASAAFDEAAKVKWPR